MTIGHGAAQPVHGGTDVALRARRLWPVVTLCLESGQRVRAVILDGSSDDLTALGAVALSLPIADEEIEDAGSRRFDADDAQVVHIVRTICDQCNHSEWAERAQWVRVKLQALPCGMG